MTTHDTLLAAAQVLRTHGWIRGDYYEPGTQRCCALGAIACAVSGTDDGLEDVNDIPGRIENLLSEPEALDAIRALGKQLGSAAGRDGVAIVSWNDHKAQSLEEVALMFEAAAASASP